MAVVTEEGEPISKLEERIRQLAATRDSLHADVGLLREKVTILTLEKEAAELEEEVNELLNEKKDLEEKVAAFDSPVVEDIEKVTN